MDRIDRLRKKLVKKHGGEIDPSGTISFPSFEQGYAFILDCRVHNVPRSWAT